MTEQNRAPAGPQPSTVTPDRASGTAPNLATPPPAPRNVPLPLGGTALMYTREHLTILYRCSHGELGRMISRRMAPLPIRVDGTILWFVDEALNQQAQVMRTLERWRKR